MVLADSCMKIDGFAYAVVLRIGNPAKPPKPSTVILKIDIYIYIYIYIHIYIYYRPPLRGSQKKRIYFLRLF